MKSVGGSMDGTVEDNMVVGLLCVTLKGCRGGYAPFAQAGAEMSDTDAVEPDPGSSWEGHSGGWVPVSGMNMRSLVGLSAQSAFHW